MPKNSFEKYRGNVNANQPISFGTKGGSRVLPGLDYTCHAVVPG